MISEFFPFSINRVIFFSLSRCWILSSMQRTSTWQREAQVGARNSFNKFSSGGKLNELGDLE